MERVLNLEPTVTRLEAIDEAISWIDPVIRSLNPTKTKCKTCGSHAYENWAEYQLVQKLEGVLSKLQQASKYIKENDLDGEVDDESR